MYLNNRISHTDMFSKNTKMINSSQKWIHLSAISAGSDRPGGLGRTALWCAFFSLYAPSFATLSSLRASAPSHHPVSQEATV